jgi:hypothetical protein
MAVGSGGSWDRLCRAGEKRDEGCCDAGERAPGASSAEGPHVTTHTPASPLLSSHPLHPFSSSQSHPQIQEHLDTLIPPPAPAAAPAAAAAAADAPAEGAAAMETDAAGRKICYVFVCSTRPVAQLVVRFGKRRVVQRGWYTAGFSPPRSRISLTDRPSWGSSSLPIFS